MILKRTILRGRSFRVLHTSSDSSSQNAPGYPFSSNARFSSPLPTEPSQPPLRGQGLMELVRKELLPPKKRQWLRTMFHRNHPDRLLPGSVISVVQNHPPTNFTGVLIGLRRRGCDSSIILRNVIQRVGVEIQIFLGSPHIKQITVLQKADGKQARRARRAKLYYLRHAPDKMTTISSSYTSKR